jgi:phosphoglucosamine mutase
MGKYFGTDGIRGLANQELQPELAFRLGRAVADVLVGESSGRPVFFIGRDTRRSGSMLEAALAAGLASAGVDVELLGVVPTPAVAWLVARHGAAAGAMISASHNPAPDNGIKLFSASGHKLPDAVEARIEALLDAPLDTLPRPTGEGVGVVTSREDRIETYVQHLLTQAGSRFEGKRVVLDVGHGAATALAPRVLRMLGAEVTVLHDAPDGDNINRGCGSTHLEVLQQAVLGGSCDLGIAFDGDADRMLAVDERGRIVDGDRLLLIALRHGLETGRYPLPRVVATVMSNLGFEEAVRNLGGELVRTPVGDRYVLEAMREQGILLGGEQSGHVIFLDANTTGDGLLSAVRLLAAVVAAGNRLSELADTMVDYPQILRNVRVRSTAGWQEHAVIREAIAVATSELEGVGRVLVRASGTEPLIRIMVEARDATLVESTVTRLADVITAALEAVEPVA